MSVLIFHAKENRYAIDIQHVHRVIPWVKLDKISSMHEYLVGLLNWGTRALPVIDFCYLIEKKMAQPAFHSRIMVVKNQQDFMGVLAEQVIDVLNLNASQFHSASFSSPFTFLDGIYIDSQGAIQKVCVEELFKFSKF